MNSRGFDGGRFDSLVIDENRAPVIVEYKRGTDAAVINPGLYYMSWLMARKDAFRHLVRDRLGASAASQVLWSAPGLICVGGDFTRYDAHAVRRTGSGGAFPGTGVPFRGRRSLGIRGTGRSGMKPPRQLAGRLNV